MFGYGPNGQTAQKKQANCTLQDLFGVENDEPAPAVVQVPGSPSENSSTSDNDDDKKRKGTALSRERITMQQKLKAFNILKRVA
jgi:hypothetical protein